MKGIEASRYVECRPVEATHIRMPYGSVAVFPLSRIGLTDEEWIREVDAVCEKFKAKPMMLDPHPYHGEDGS